MAQKFNDLDAVGKCKVLKKRKALNLAGKWMSIISPFVIIGAVNFNDYFTEANGVKMSLGCTLACFVAGVAIFNESKDNKKINGLVGWAIAIALCWLLSSILQDLLLILTAGFCGQLVGKGFEIAEDVQVEQYNIFNQATITAQANAEAFKMLNN